ncbi:Flp family type IVb pilin [Sutcliffiella halmapala]|uniref:Flp family type IVb pilin n=1 Tax=Sutcliffiella halmapala TaxID=79882 RepID=UPI000995B09E|nr:hypothetical protein [Sutcliffiella halmapala]
MKLFFWKNERGYALLIVLLTIVIIGLFIPPIMSSILSSATQFNKSEEKVQHQNLVGMSVNYFERTVTDLLEMWKLPEDWVPPTNWDTWTEAQKESYFNTMIIQYIETELGKRNFQANPPPFRANGTQFTLSYRVNKSGGQVIFELDIYTKIDGGDTVTTKEKLPMPPMNFNITSSSS